MKKVIYVELNTSRIRCVFDKYNKLCFDGKLPYPKISIFTSKHTLGRFTSTFDDDNNMHDPIIEISDSYKYTKEKLEDIIVHEMIHYYLAYTKVDVYLTHKKPFKEMAKKLNKEHGLHITEEIDVKNMKRVKKDGWISKIWKEICKVDCAINQGKVILR